MLVDVKENSSDDATVSTTTSRVRVEKVVEGGEAYKRGVRAGFFVLAVNGIDLDGTASAANACALLIKSNIVDLTLETPGSARKHTRSQGSLSLSLSISLSLALLFSSLLFLSRFLLTLSLSLSLSIYPSIFFSFFLS